MADSIAVKISQLRSLPRLAVQFPTRRNHRFQFFGASVPSLVNRPPPSEKPKPEAHQIPQRLSSSFFNQQGAFRVPRFEQLGQKKEKKKMKKEGFENAPC